MGSECIVMVETVAGESRVSLTQTGNVKMTDPSTRRLRETIHELEAELERIESLDPETQAMLRRAVDDLQETLRRKTGGEAPDTSGVLGQLEELEREFQVQHPTLAGVVLRAVEALRQLGI